jgi:type IV pilus assembly protein PilO
MALADSLRSLREIDFNDLTLDTIGSWPMPMKVLVWVVVFGVVVFLGYNYHLKAMQTSLDDAVAQENRLREEFKQKAFQAANLDALRQQLVEMEEQFGALLGQLPADTEVPGLLEDITERGLESGLEFNSIALQPERVAPLFIELPIDINVTGSYHDFGSFVSLVADMPRIVTLHDFSISPIGESSRLQMRIQAKTYRYKGEG